MATLPASSSEPPLGRDKTRAEPRTVMFALLFAAVTYALVSGRALLNPDHSYALWSGPRFASVVVGAGLFWCALRLVEGWKERPVRELALRALALVVPASLAMFGARLLIDLASEGNMLPAASLRWVLVWMGYFTTSLTAAVALHLYSRIEQLSAFADSDSVAAAATGTAQVEESLWVQRQGGTVKLPLEAIEWVEAEGNYVRIHAGEASGLIRTPLAVMEARLGDVEFVRVHRSIICRTSAIRAVKRRRNGAMLAELGSGVEVPVGRSYGDRVKALRDGFPATDVRPTLISSIPQG